MSNPQPNAWQTATTRSRHSHSASRTPQNRSGTGSPNPQTTSTPPSQAPRADSGRSPLPVNSAWASRSSSAGGSNGPQRAQPAAPLREEPHTPVNHFNAKEVREFLRREAAPASYKPADVAGAGRASGGAWGTKANHMANNQPFFIQLAKQVATMEGGG